MKKLLIIPILAFSLMSCDSHFSEPTNVRDLNYTFSNGSAVMAWLADSYNYMPNSFFCTLTATVDYAANEWKWSNAYITMSDEADLNTTRECYKSFRMNLGDWNASEGGFGEKWVPLYQQIRHLHVFLDNVKVVPGQKEIDSQDKVDALKVEARFLIAYFHTLLFEQFGPIPIIRGAVDVNTPTEELKVERNSVDEVVNWLDTELLSIANALPKSITNDFYGAKPTQAAALAIRARLLLYAASPLFNSPDNYATLREFYTLSNRDGKRLFPQNYDETKWKRAADAAKLLIDTQTQYELIGATAEGVPNTFEDAYKYYRSVFTEPMNKEVLFARSLMVWTNWTDFDEYLQTACPKQYGAGGMQGITQKLVDAFYLDDGTLAEEGNPRYDETGFTTVRDQITLNKLIAKDDYKIDEVYNMYQNREARFYASVFFNGRKWESENAKLNGVVQPADFLLGGLSGGPGYVPATGVMPYKYIAAEDYKGKSQIKRPILFRLAEVYLSYAEALNQYAPGDPDILKYLNKVRNRAGLPDYEEAFPDKTSQEEIKQAILRERMIELNWEGTRYFDTRRHLIAETEDNGPFYGMNVNGDSKTTFYKRTVFENRVFKKAFYLYPIPQSEIDVNEKLVQNPYWK